MARSVTIASGKTNVLLPDGGTYDAGDTVTLTDAQFDEIRDALFPDTVIDNGVVATAGDEVVDQGANVAAPAAITSSAPAAATATMGALTSAQITGAEDPTEAEYNALQADVAALRTAVLALIADDLALRTSLTAVRTDAVNLRATVAALETALSGTGKALANS